MPAIADAATAVANVRKTLAIVIRNLKVVSARSTLAGHVNPGCGHHVAESKSVAMLRAPPVRRAMVMKNPPSRWPVIIIPRFTSRRSNGCRAAPA